MKKRERAQFVAQELMRLFPQVPIPLMHSDAYTLLIAVLLSAQCTDERVNQVTPHLFRLARDPLGMAQRSVDEIHAIIRPCGLGGQKAKAIHRLSELLLERHGGLVPNDLGALEALSGVGHKTASVVMCQAFGQPAFPVDTHIHRLAKRWRLSKAQSVKQTEQDLKALFPKQQWCHLHLRFIYYGRAYCPARGHDLSRCPICFHLENN